MQAFGFQRLFILFLVAMATLGTRLVAVDQIQFLLNSQSATFLDTDGTPITAGSADANQDGGLIQLGFFSEATTENPFAGDWIPLSTGPHIGDSATLTGAQAGTFQSSIVFQENSPIATVYPGDAGEYQVLSSITITDNDPGFGKLLAIRYFDRSTIEPGVKYNTIADPAWQWGGLSGFPFPILVGVDPDADGLAFQDPDNPFIASVGMNTEVAGQPYLTVSANITGGGLVRGVGKYEEGATAQLQAVEAEGYDFIGWSGDLAGDAPTGSFVVNVDKVVNAEFQIQSFDVTTGISPAEGGSVTGAGTYDYNEQATFTAIPANGFHLQFWSVDGEPVPNEQADGNNLTLTITRDTLVEASFGVTFYSVTILLSPETGGTATGGGTVTYGTTQDITAIPSTGFEFETWEGPGILDPTSASTSVTVTADLSLMAKFSPLPGQAFEVSASFIPADGGTVSGAGIYSTDTTVDLTANPENGYYLEKWSDEDGNFYYGNPLQLTVNSDLTRNAIFAKRPYILSVTGDSEFEVFPPDGSGTHVVGDTIELVAHPIETWELANWSLGGEVDFIVRALPSLDNTQTALFTDGYERRDFRLIRGGTYRFDLTSQDMAGNPFYFSTSPVTDLSGNFDGEYTEGVSNTRASSGIVEFTVPETAPDTLYYHISSAPGAGGTIHVHDFSEVLPEPSTNPSHLAFPADVAILANYQRAFYLVDGIAAPSHGGTVTGTGDLEWGTEATFQAIPATDYLFTSWDGLPTPGETQNPVTVTIEGGMIVVANFTYTGDATHNLTLSANPPEGGTVTGAGEITHATVANISATPAAGFRFVNWTGVTVEDPQLSSTSTPILLGDMSLIANFEPIPKHTLTLQSNPPGAGTFFGDGEYFEGTTITILANPSALYAFAGWTGSDQISNPSFGTTNLTITEDTTVTGNFTYTGPSEFDLTLQSSPEEGGTTEGAGIHEHGQTVPIKATPAPGYEFDGWTGGTPVSPASIETEIQILGETTLTANFNFVGLPVHSLGLLPNPLEGGTVNGAGDYDVGTVVQIEAVPAEGYEFQGWNGGSPATPTSATTTLTIDGDTTLFANFRFTGGSTHTLTISSEPTTGGSATGEGSYPTNSTATLQATPAEGYKFIGWSGGTVQSPDSAQTQVNVNTNLTLTANFALLGNFTLATQANPTQAGTTTGDGEYLEGTQIPVTATAAEGYTFVGWSGGQTAASTEATTTHTLAADTTLFANFIYTGPSTHSLSLAISPAEAGVLAGSGTYGHGAQVLISASPRHGYLFRHWTDGAGTTITDNPTRIPLEKSLSLTAIFDKIQVSAPLGQEGGEWIASDWFGAFHRSGNGWVFSSNHGWLFPSGTSDSSVWFATPGGGWYWTSQDSYPWFYNNQSGAWVYFSATDSSPGASLLYDTGTGSWVTVSPPGLP